MSDEEKYAELADKVKALQEAFKYLSSVVNEHTHDSDGHASMQLKKL